MNAMRYRTVFERAGRLHSARRKFPDRPREKLAGAQAEAKVFPAVGENHFLPLACPGLASRKLPQKENGLARKTLSHCVDGGAERDRTADLVIAKGTRRVSAKFHSVL